MKYLAPLMLLPLLAACDEAAMADLRGEEPEPEVISWPAHVMAALPAGVPPSVIFVGPDNCYLTSVEVTEPRSGYPLRGRDGQPICVTPAAAPATTAEPAA